MSDDGDYFVLPGFCGFALLDCYRYVHESTQIVNAANVKSILNQTKSLFKKVSCETRCRKS